MAKCELTSQIWESQDLVTRKTVAYLHSQEMNKNM